MTSKKRQKRLRARQKGQATTEYVLLMVVLVIAIVAVGRTLRDRMQVIVDRQSQSLTRQFLSGAHKFVITVR